MFQAVERRQVEVIKVLVSSAPSAVSMKDNHGRTPRDCVGEGSDELIKLLEQVT